MDVILLIYLIVWANRWMHRYDQMLYTPEELELMRREQEPPPVDSIGLDPWKIR